MFNRFVKACVVLGMCIGWSAQAEDETPETRQKLWVRCA